MSQDAAPGSDEVAALRAALAAEQSARREAEARASGAEVMVAHLKLLIAKLRQDRFSASSERGRNLLDQMELELEGWKPLPARTSAAEHDSVTGLPRRRPVRGPLPAYLPRERVMVPSPTACPCCGGELAKLGESITETQEVVLRQWKVIRTVHENWSCRSCETITQPPAPFHPIPRGRAGADHNSSLDHRP